MFSVTTDLRIDSGNPLGYNTLANRITCPVGKATAGIWIAAAKGWRHPALVEQGLSNNKA